MTDSRTEALGEIEAAWLRLTYAHKELEAVRGDFVAALIDGEAIGIKQKDMASRCITDNGHISRSRIAQYLQEK